MSGRPVMGRSLETTEQGTGFSHERGRQMARRKVVVAAVALLAAFAAAIAAAPPQAPQGGRVSPRGRGRSLTNRSLPTSCTARGGRRRPRRRSSSNSARAWTGGAAEFEAARRAFDKAGPLRGDRRPAGEAGGDKPGRSPPAVRIRGDAGGIAAGRGRPDLPPASSNPGPFRPTMTGLRRAESNCLPSSYETGDYQCSAQRCNPDRPA